MRILAVLLPVLLFPAGCFRGLGDAVAKGIFAQGIPLGLLTRFTIRIGPPGAGDVPLVPLLAIGYEPSPPPGLAGSRPDPVWINLADFGAQTPDGLPIGLGVRIQAPVGPGVVPSAQPISVFRGISFLTPAWDRRTKIWWVNYSLP